jgi:hypothetical protein
MPPSDAVLQQVIHDYNDLYDEQPRLARGLGQGGFCLDFLCCTWIACTLQ